MTDRYVLYSTKLTGQVRLVNLGPAEEVLERLMAAGGFDPGTDGKMTIERYTNIAEDPHKEKDEETRPIEFYGYSDDTVIAERGGEFKDAGAFDRTRVCEITAPDGSAIRVFGAYYPNHEGNGWGFGLVQAGEEDGEPVPDWAQDVRFERNGDPDYSVRMYVYAPEGSTFRWMGEDDE